MTNERELELLKAARAKIELGWCQNANARDKYGDDVSPNYPEAVQWCIIGATLAVAGNVAVVSRMQDMLKLSAGIGDVPFTNSLSWFNDKPGRTKYQVLALFDEAIGRVEAREVVK